MTTVSLLERLAVMPLPLASEVDYPGCWLNMVTRPLVRSAVIDLEDAPDWGEDAYGSDISDLSHRANYWADLLEDRCDSHE